MTRFFACGFLALALLLAPWCFGSAEPWSRLLLQMLAALALLFAAASSEKKRQRRELHWILPAVGLTTYLAVQALNASSRYQPHNQGLIPLPHVVWLPHSVDAAVTGTALGLFLAYAALFYAARVCLIEISWQSVLLHFLLANGFLLALIGTLHHISGDAKVLWIRSTEYGGTFFGPLNRNHYAAYINLLLPVALFLGRHVQRHPERHGNRSSPSWLYYFCAAVMAASVFVSQSRAGSILCGGILLAWLVVEGWHRRASAHRRTLCVALGAILLSTGGLLLYLGVEPLQRIGTLGADLQYRAIAYRATAELVREHWLYGIGSGAFHCAFPFYQPNELQGFLRHVHCDWLESLAELGLVGFALAVACVALPLWKRWAAPREPVAHEERSHSRESWLWRLRAALVIGLGALAIHASLDFPLAIPAVLSLATVLIAILSIPISSPPRP